MTQIFVTTYEVRGGGLPIADSFYREVKIARNAHWKFVESVSGEGYRPNHDGGLRSVLFNEVPPAWRRVGSDGKYIEARPHKGSVAGKRLAQCIEELPRLPRAESLVSQLGYHPSEMAMDHRTGCIYFPTQLRVLFPTERIFVRLPRFENDGFEPDPDMLHAIPESEFMKAVEDHNAEARRLKVTPAQGGAA